MMPTIGQRLKTEREEQRLTLEKVFEATRIRVQYLEALEADDLSVMPSPVQARGYLRNYAEFLGFDADQMLNELRVMSTLPPSGPVMGPADGLLPNPEPEEVKAQSATPTPEVAQAFEAPPPAIEESIIPLHTEYDGLTVPRKPARRKKKSGTAEQLAPDTPEPVTRKRARKKAEPEMVQVIPLPDSPAQVEIPPQADPAPQQEQLASVEPIFEPVAGEPLGSEPDASPSDRSDTLWQAWLNRLGSVLSGQMKRRTLVPKELPPAESEARLLSPEPVSLAGTVPDDPPIESWNSIFKEIGRELRSRRELLSLHFDEVERNTHVKAHYLDALERGALDELPSTVQTRGMLSNYATFLDLDVDALLLRFADALQARHRERNPQKPPRKPGQPIIANIPSVRSFIAGDMIFGVGMAVLLVGFAIWGVSRVMTIQSQQDEEVQPTAPSISDVLLASPDPASFTATPTFLPVEAFPGEPTVTLEIPTLNVNAPVQLNLIAVERTYMRVTVDGEVMFDGRVIPGNAYPFEAETQVEVLVGSGAAIRTVYNGR
ncbi:MAG TPA: helix-turn-helix domain-containing protein, partial [Anaerolineales bacterium]|nr:helix-turn-helix domain-containing protein [Anaerolineales bacterium]